MNDLELLEAAAKAAGIVKFHHATSDGRAYLWRNDQRWGSEVWAPLDDDGDALRLAVDLRLTVLESSVRKPDGDVVNVFPGEARDRFAATRLAIVRAAAAMCPRVTPNAEFTGTPSAGPVE